MKKVHYHGFTGCGNASVRNPRQGTRLTTDPKQVTCERCLLQMVKRELTNRDGLREIEEYLDYQADVIAESRR